jgi:hypothetical protein
MIANNWYLKVKPGKIIFAIFSRCCKQNFTLRISKAEEAFLLSLKIQPSSPPWKDKINKASTQRGLNTRRPTSSSFWVPRNLSNHIDRQARTGDTVLVKNREIAGRTQTMPQWLGGLGVKTTEIKIHLPRCLYLSLKKEPVMKKDGTNLNDSKIDWSSLSFLYLSYPIE